LIKVLLNIIFLFGLNYFSLISLAQDTLPLPSNFQPVINSNNLQFSFKKTLVEFSKGEMISNVLAIYNNKNIEIKFYADISIPTKWSALTQKNKLYTLAPGDSTFIPIHILPKINLRGSSRFLFTVYLYNENDEPYGFTFFYGETKKNISWQLSTNENKIYLLNKQTTAPFNITLGNSGSYDQDIHLTLFNVSKSVSLLDSTGQFEAKQPITLNLKSQKDTTFYYTFSKHVEPRNYRLVDIEGYNPYSLGEEKKYTVTANSTSPNPSDYNKFRAGAKIDFVQLSDLWTVNQYGNDVIPLLVDLNAFNILGAQPMLNLTLQGQTFLHDSSTIVYNSQLTYSSNYFTTNPYQNAMLYLGYFHSKFNVQYGNITGGVMGTYQNGRGIKAEYYINKNQRIGGFFTNSPRLFSKNPDYTTFGLTHNYQNSILRINSQFGHSISNVQHKFTDVLNVNASTNFIKNHTFGIRAGVSRNVKQDSLIVKYGWMGGVYYNGQYLHQKMNSNLSAMYISPTFGIYSYEQLTVNAGNQYHLNKKWNIFLNNNYYRYFELSSTFYKPNFQLNNQLNFNRVNSKAGNFTPFTFYNFSRIQDFRVQSRGLGLNLGKYNLNENYRYFINILSGYNRAIDTLSKDYFFLQFAGFVQIRTVSFSTRYQLGNRGISKTYFLYNSAKNPQSITLSLRHQYVFPRPAFVMQNAVSYSYSTLSGKSINFNPEFYCFTKGGWRFRIFAEINFSLSANSDIRETYYMYSGNGEVSQPQWNKGFYLGVGIRKEFGIPIPKTKNKYCTINFVVFYDINGDGKRNHNEALLENIVIKTDAWEIITNKDGEATLKNVPVGAYPFNVFSIPDLKGWFPHINDTITFSKSEKVYIPFARGVKVTGKVFLDKDKISADADKQMDLSRIKISAINARTFTTLTRFDGTFEFYIPIGSYILTMDEKVLGERYQLLQNNFELKIDDKFDNLFIPFYIIEKRRKVKVTKFDNNGNKVDNPIIERENVQPSNNPIIEQPKPEIEQPSINDTIIEEKHEDIKPIDEPKVNNEDNYNYGNMSDLNELDSLISILLSKNESPLSEEDLAKIEENKTTPNDLSKYGDKVVYSIQIGAFIKGDLPREILAKLGKLIKIGKVESFEDEKGITRFFVGNYTTLNEATFAKNELAEIIKDVFIIGINKGKIITAKKAFKLNGK